MFNHPRCQSLIDQGAIFLVNTSGGKDSQVMTNLLLANVPHEQLLFVHAHLGKVEWPGVIEHIERTVPLPVHVVSAGKTFFDMVEHRQMWPSPKQRQSPGVWPFGKSACGNKPWMVSLSIGPTWRGCAGSRAPSVSWLPARILPGLPVCAPICSQSMLPWNARSGIRSSCLRKASRRAIWMKY